MSTKWSSSSFSSPCSSVDKSHLKHMCLDFGVFFKKILLPPPPSLSVGQLCRDLGPNSLLELPPGVFDSFFDEYVRQGAFPPPPLFLCFFSPSRKPASIAQRAYSNTISPIVDFCRNLSFNALTELPLGVFNSLSGLSEL